MCKCHNVDLFERVAETNQSGRLRSLTRECTVGIQMGILVEYSFFFGNPFHSLAGIFSVQDPKLEYFVHVNSHYYETEIKTEGE